jgi:UDP-glucose 4-epimerase
VGASGGARSPDVTTTYLLLGGGGVLGSGYRSALAQRGAHAVRLSPVWGRPGAAAAGAGAALLPASERGDVVIVWAAGVGHIGANESQMRAETAEIASIGAEIAKLPRGSQARVSLLFASSAGALFGGRGRGEILEDDEPRPVTSYGIEKLRQEELLRDLSGDSGCRVMICRYTNLYGLADEKLTSRGLVSTAVRATRLRQPMIVYVSADTRRDLVYSRDAAEESLQLLDAAPPGVTTALVCAGETRTVSGILALVGRVSGRRVPATYAERAETRLQPLALRFRSPNRPLGQPRRTPMETVLHLMLRAPLAV